MRLRESGNNKDFKESVQQIKQNEIDNPIIKQIPNFQFMDMDKVKIEPWNPNPPVPGSQIVGYVYNGVKITHLETGIVVCVNFHQRSQYKNLKIAMKMLDAIPKELINQ